MNASSSDLRLPPRGAPWSSIWILSIALTAATPAWAQSQTSVTTGQSTGQPGVVTFDPANGSEASPSQPETLIAPQALSAPEALDAPQTRQIPANDDTAGAVGSSASDQNGNDVQVDVLHSLSIDSVGTLSEIDGGFGPKLWSGADADEVRPLIEGVPLPLGSAVLRDMLRRAMLSAAPPPMSDDADKSAAGTGGGSTVDNIADVAPASVNNHVKGGDFIALRLRTLLRMDDPNDARTLLATIPDSGSNMALLDVSARLDLLDKNYPAACGKTATGTRESAKPFWQRLLVVCQALSGAQPQAELGLSLLQDEGNSDPLFNTLIRAVLDQKPAELDGLPGPDPLTMAMFDLSHSTIAPAVLTDGLSDASPRVLLALLGDDQFPAANRGTLIKALTAKGALSGDALRALFEQARYDDKQMANPISSAHDLDTVSALGLLYQASKAQTVDAARAEAVDGALTRARDDGMFATAASAFLPLVRSIPARTDLVWFAGDAARSLLLAGDTNSAQGWVSILRSASLLDSEAHHVLTQITPLLHLAGMGQKPVLTQDVEQWWAQVSSDPSSRHQAALFLTLLEANDPGASVGLWRIVAGNAGVHAGEGVDLALWHRLSGAASQGQVGVGVLMAIHLLGAGDISAADPLALQHVVLALRKLGLERAAKDLILESAVRAGL